MQPGTRVGAEFLQLGMTKTNWGPQESGDRQETQRSGVEAGGINRTPSASKLPSGLCTPPLQGSCKYSFSVEPLAQSQRLRVLIHRKASGLTYLWKKAEGLALRLQNSSLHQSSWGQGPGARAGYWGPAAPQLLLGYFGPVGAYQFQNIWTKIAKWFEPSLGGSVGTSPWKSF